MPGAGAGDLAVRALALTIAALLLAGAAHAGEALPDIEREQCRRPEAVMTVAALVLSNDSDCVCGTKTKCGQMDSCAEARCFLEKCGVTRLDGDGDGTPCESICG